MPFLPRIETFRKNKTLVGMTAAVVCFFMFSIMNLFAKMLSERMHIIEVSFFRNFIASLPFLFLIYGMKKREILVIRGNPWMLIVRSVLGTASLAATFTAFSLLPMATTSAFLFTSSLIVPALGFFFLKERVSPHRWLAIVVGFLGVLIMLKPTGGLVFWGVCAALGAAFLHASLQTLLRALGRTESPETVTFYFLFIGAFICLIPLPFVFTMPTVQDIPLILGCGISGALAQFFLSTAYKNAEVALVTVFNYSGLIWSTLFGWMIWDDFPSPTILTGGIILIGSNIFILYREHKRAIHNTPPAALE